MDKIMRSTEIVLLTLNFVINDCAKYTVELLVETHSAYFMTLIQMLSQIGHIEHKAT